LGHSQWRIPNNVNFRYNRGENIMG
jgi:hypothetical protein